jgi:sulfur-carrier protein
MSGVVRVRFFASLREAVGRSEVPITGADDLDTVLAALSRDLDANAWQQLRAPAVRIAVNRTLVEGNVSLRDGDEVAFLPPVTGG